MGGGPEFLTTPKSVFVGLKKIIFFLNVSGGGEGGGMGLPV